MFIGEYVHTLDSKKRLAVPTRMRKALSGTVVLTAGPDGCLFLYTKEEWEKLADKLSKLPIGQADTRNFVRLTFAQAEEQEIDSLGRVLIPDRLKKYAGFEGKVVVVGVFNRIELWSPERWESIRERTLEDADKLAERLGELGAY